MVSFFLNVYDSGKDFSFCSFNICMATEITGTHEYPSSYTLSIITIMQRGNDPSLFLPKGKRKKRKIKRAGDDCITQ